jgi:hypothetical protein
MWTQIVGKVRLAAAPPASHWWQVPLYVTSRGLTTSPVPYGARLFQIDFDFVAHRLIIEETTGGRIELALVPKSVARFYAEVMDALRSLDIQVRISTNPVEVATSIPFELDEEHATYDSIQAHLLWQSLVQAHRLLTIFAGRFLGKVSPVHFFWGSADLAVTRFSGRRAPLHEGGPPNCPPWVTEEAYSHEVSSAGWWPGDARDEPAFYSYMYPEPEGFGAAAVRPAAARYNTSFGEFLLPYAAVRRSPSPDDAVLDFLESTYAAGADLAAWDRAELEPADYPADAPPNRAWSTRPGR